MNWCFLILIEKKISVDLINKMKVRIYLCSTHYLKSMIKNSKEIDVAKPVRRFFIYFFTLIQNSSSLQQIELYLINIHNVFLSVNFDASVQYSLQMLTNELKK